MELKTRMAESQWPLRMWVEMALFHFKISGSLTGALDLFPVADDALLDGFG